MFDTKLEEYTLTEEKLNITYEGEKDDCISVVVMTSGTTPLSAWENIAEENKTAYTHYFKDGSNHEITASGGYPSNVAFTVNSPAYSVVRLNS